MKEKIDIPFNLETEVKLERYAEVTGMTRDEVISKVVSLFLSKLGF